MLSRRCLLAGGLASLALAGCRPSTRASSTSAPKPTSLAGLKYFASLPGLKASSHALLQAELARLEEEKQTPLQIDAALPPAKTKTSSTPPLQDLERAFPLLSRQLVLQQVAEAYPVDGFATTPAQQERAKELLVRYKHGRALFSQCLPASGSGYGLQTAHGYLAKYDFLDVLEIGVRLSLLSAADHLRSGDFPATIDELQLASEALIPLAKEPSLLARSTATRLRGEWCAASNLLLQSLVLPQDLRLALLQSIRAQQSQLVPAAFHFSAERAAGLLVYEWVRQGSFLSLLSSEEIKTLTDQGLLPATRQAAQQNVDEDELFYLTQMRQLIAASSRPFFSQLETFQKINDELATRQKEGTYPLLAARLLQDLQAASRWIALDETHLAAQEIALATSLSVRPQSPEICPLNGNKFTVESTSFYCSVRYSLSDPAQTKNSDASETVSCPLAESLAMPERRPTSVR